VQTVVWAVAMPWMLDYCSKHYGEEFTVRFFPSGRKIVVVSGAERVKQVFTASPEVAPSAAGISPVAPVMGPSSVLTLTGPEHIRQRRLLLPPFHGERMKEYEDVIVEATKRDVATWPEGTPMSLQERTRAITLEVILRAVFGVEAERMDPLREAIGGLFVPLKLPMLLLVALRAPSMERPKGAFGRALDHLDEVTYKEIARRRAQKDLGERTDILSLLMQARDEEGVAMTDAELRDELVTLLLAGHETTATSVAWAIERLVRHPDKLKKLIEEIDAGESEEYQQAVVNETMRVRPVVPMVVRILNGAVEGRRARTAKGDAGGAVDLADESRQKGIRGPRGVPPRALPGEPARDVLVDTVRRRDQALHRCVVRNARDEANATYDPQRGAAKTPAGAPKAQARRRADPQARDHAGARGGHARGVEQTRVKEKDLDEDPHKGGQERRSQ
jgi:cytochrome P450